MNLLKEWWQGLSARDQKFLTGGGVIAALLLTYSLIWSPLSAAISQRKHQVAEQRATLQWLQTAAAKLQQYRSHGFNLPLQNNQPLITFLSNSLNDNDLHRYAPKIAPTASNTVTIEFKQVPFDILIAWLEKLWRNYDLDIKTLAINSSPIQGTVQAKLVFDK